MTGSAKPAMYTQKFNFILLAQPGEGAKNRIIDIIIIITCYYDCYEDCVTVCDACIVGTNAHLHCMYICVNNCYDKCAYGTTTVEQLILCN